MKQNKTKKSWFDKHIEHSRNIDQIMAKNGTYKYILAAIFIFACVCVAGYAIVVGGITHAAAGIGTDNPEIIAEMIDSNFAWATLAKQIPMNIEIEGDFRGVFTNKTNRTLEKADLECQNEFYFVVIGSNWTQFDRDRQLDPECEMRDLRRGKEYYRCPTHNCDRRVVNRTVVDDFLPTSVKITKISIKTGR